MFCSTCGKQINENLNFCNGCGARLDSKTEETQTNSFGLNSATVTGVLGMFGLFGFVFLAIKLIEKNLDPGFVFSLLALFMAAVLGICFFILRQNSAQSLRPRKKEKADEEYVAPKKLFSESSPQLAASYQPPVSSVTENTTRTLDEVLAERK